MQNREKYAVASRRIFNNKYLRVPKPHYEINSRLHIRTEFVARVVGKTLNLKYATLTRVFPQNSPGGRNKGRNFARNKVSRSHKPIISFDTNISCFSSIVRTLSQNTKILFLDWVNICDTVYLSAIHKICNYFSG